MTPLRNNGNEMEISKDLKKVIYDGHVYKVKQVIKLSKDTPQIVHVCNNRLTMTYDWNYVVDIKKTIYYATFCNRCKYLFIRKVK